MIKLSASASARALACPTSLILPQQDYRTSYADAGSERHADMEDAAENDRDALPEVVRELIRPGDKVATEIGFAFMPDESGGTARTLGRVANREYGAFALRPFEIPGTIDMLIAGNRRVVVVDYKGFEEVSDAESNAQTLTYALMVARTYGYHEVTVVIVYLVANRRPSIFTLTRWELDEHAARLYQLTLDAIKAQANPEAFLATGPHCKYCPAFLSCPRQKALVQEVQQGIVTLRVEAMLPLDDDEKAADAYELISTIGMLGQRLRAVVSDRAKERPIPLRNGKVYGLTPKLSNEKLIGDVAYEVVRAKHGQAIADQAVERKATKTKLREALGFVAGKGKVTALEKETLALIRERGGVEPRTTKMTLEEHEPQPLLKAVND